MSKRRDKDPSVFNEPWLKENGSETDSVSPDKRPLTRRQLDKLEDELVEHTVWDEPSLADRAGRGADTEGLTWSQWYLRRCGQTSLGYSWLMTLLIAVAAGPFAVIAALTSGQAVGIPAIAMMFYVVLLGPMVEEIVKTAMIAYVVEKRPYLLRSRLQIFLMALASSLAFASIENLMYLNILIKDPSPVIFQWRWTVCTFMHCGCTTIAGLGLMRLWKGVKDRREKANMTGLYPYLATAIVLHSAYNAWTVIMEQTELLKF